MKQAFHIPAATAITANDKVLSIRIGERHFGFAITDAVGGELYQLDWYTDEEVDENLLEQLYQQLSELRHTYERVNLCYDHPRSLLVPMEKYQPGQERLLVNAMFGPGVREHMLMETISEWQLNNVYAVPSGVHKWVAHYFNKGQFWHTYSIGIRNIEAAGESGSMLLDFRTDDFSLLAARNGQVLLAQTFCYTNPADVIYYLLKICQDFSFSQETVQIFLSGLVDKASVLYREIYQYFIQVQFRQSSWAIVAEETADYPSHFFTSLNDLARCAS